MFEKFTTDARAVVVAARAEAERRGDGWLGTEHVLVGLLVAGGPELTVLTDHGVALEAVRARIAAHVPTGDGDDLDADALSTLGIDLDAVRRAVEEQFGEGALAPTRRSRRVRTTRRAKKVLELALREAHRLHASSITSAHLLLGVLREGRGLAVLVLAETGTDLIALRRDTESLARQDRAA